MRPKGKEEKNSLLHTLTINGIYKFSNWVILLVKFCCLADVPTWQKDNCIFNLAKNVYFQLGKKRCIFKLAKKCVISTWQKDNCIFQAEQLHHQNLTGVNNGLYRKPNFSTTHYSYLYLFWFSPFFVLFVFVKIFNCISFYFITNEIIWGCSSSHFHLQTRASAWFHLIRLCPPNESWVIRKFI